MVRRSDAVVKPVRRSGRHEGFDERGACLGISQVCPWATPQPAPECCIQDASASISQRQAACGTVVKITLAGRAI
jgi:hypothetical protein